MCWGAGFTLDRVRCICRPDASRCDGYRRLRPQRSRANMRRHLEVEHFHIARTVLAAEGKMSAKGVTRTIKVYKIDEGAESDWGLL